MTSADTNVNLIINQLTQTQYDTLSAQGLIDDNQLYLIPDEGDMLSGYVKLSSDTTQTISSKIGITKSLTVGSLSVASSGIDCAGNAHVEGWLKVGNLQVNESGSSKAEWGYITGNIEDQTDLTKVNYPLDNPIEQSEVFEGTTYRRFDVKDHTIASITLSTSTPVRIHFPDKPTENFCRDFIVKVRVISETIPQVYFVKGENDDSIGFEYTDENWTELEAGINYFTFTETERS